MKKKKSEVPEIEKPAPREDPPYMKAFGGVWTNDKVGQVFVTRVKKPLPKTKDE